MTDSLESLAYRKVSDYVLIRAIGRGTHYTLYQAVEPIREQMVVIKVLHVAVGKPTSDPNVASDPNLASVLETRLKREAQALSALSHPNIPALYETGEQDGYPFLVMEYLVGHPLRQHLDQRALPLDEAIRILEQVACALDAVHAHGILHRDVRASNVMILHDGSVKLVEFGLARQPGDATVTLMGTLVGEPAYMAPEQLRNQPATPQSDIWALGVLLYEMLAGRPPFEGANFQLVAHQVIMGQPTPAPELSEALQAVLIQALEKDPEKRFPQAQEMVQAVRKAAGLTHAPMLSQKKSRTGTVPKLSSSKMSFKMPASKMRFAWAAALLVVTAASILLGLRLAHHPFSLSPTVFAADKSKAVFAADKSRAGRPPMAAPTGTQPAP